MEKIQLNTFLQIFKVIFLYNDHIVVPVELQNWPKIKQSIQKNS